MESEAPESLKFPSDPNVQPRDKNYWSKGTFLLGSEGDVDITIWFLAKIQNGIQHLYLPTNTLFLKKGFNFKTQPLLLDFPPLNDTTRVVLNVLLFLTLTDIEAPRSISWYPSWYPVPISPSEVQTIIFSVSDWHHHLAIGFCIPGVSLVNSSVLV